MKLPWLNSIFKCLFMRNNDAKHQVIQFSLFLLDYICIRNYFKKIDLALIILCDLSNVPLKFFSNFGAIHTILSQE